MPAQPLPSAWESVMPFVYQDRVTEPNHSGQGDVSEYSFDKPTTFTMHRGTQPLITSQPMTVAFPAPTEQESRMTRHRMLILEGPQSKLPSGWSKGYQMFFRNIQIEEESSEEEGSEEESSGDSKRGRTKVTVTSLDDAKAKLSFWVGKQSRKPRDLSTADFLPHCAVDELQVTQDENASPEPSVAGAKLDT